MKKWIALILIILAVFALGAAAYAEEEPEQQEPLYINLEPPAEHVEGEPDFLLWKPDRFEIHTNITNRDLLFYYDTDAEPMWVYVDESGYGEAWFTAGTTDANPYEAGEAYNADNPVHEYTARVEFVGDDGEVIAESEPYAFTAGILSTETPEFAPEVTNVTPGGLKRDGVFSMTVSHEADFQTMCVVLFDENGEPVVDSHWIDVVEGAEPAVIETPLLRLEVNRQYTARIYGLKHGYPMAWAENTYNILVLSPDSQAEDTDILIMGLKDEYLTGELIMPTIYYPNSEGMENIQMEISVFASRYENTPYRWDRDMYLWPDETGGIYYQPETWDDPLYSWNDGEHIFRVKIWLNDNGQHVLLDSFETEFDVTSEGPTGYDPRLPAFVHESELPYTITVPRPDANNYRMFAMRFSMTDENDFTELFYDDAGDEPMQVTLERAGQVAVIRIQAEKHGYDLFDRSYTIPVVSNVPRIHVWTDIETNGALPLHTSFPIRVSAPGADWIEAQNADGTFFHEDDPDRINGEDPIEFEGDIRQAGENRIYVFAQFTDGEGNQTFEWDVLVLRGYSDGEAGPFTATIDKNEAERGENATVIYTKSENADHYWVHAEIRREDGEWEWVSHLADLNVWDENEGGTAVLSTIELEPGTYRLTALAEGEGYYAFETVITDEFTVFEPEIPESGILVTVTSDSVETKEEIQVSAYAPGAEWTEVYWNYANDSGKCEGNGGDSSTWSHFYDRSGAYRIMVKAGRDARDEEGNEIWESDGEGHSWKVCDEWWSDPVDVDVTAENGPLTLAVPEGIPAVLEPCGEGERQISFTASKPENADIVLASVWIEGEDRELYFDYTWEDGLNVSVSPGLEAGQTLRISLYADARGYESANIDLRIPVTAFMASGDVQLIVSEGDFSEENGKYSVPMGGTVMFLVGAAEGHEVTAAKLYTPDGWWGGGEEIRHDNHDDWFDNAGRAFFQTDFCNENNIGRDVPIYAVARLDGSENWVQSRVLLVRQEGYRIGEYDFASLATIALARGMDANFVFTEAAGADRYWVDAWKIGEDGDSYNPSTSCSGRTVTLNTAQLPVGEYVIRGRAGADGKGWREAANPVRLVVGPSDVPNGTVRLTVDKEAALTGEEISASVFAPGADWVEIYRRHAGTDWQERIAERGGEGAAGTFSEGDEKTVEVYALAHYFERDGQGNPIPEEDDPNRWKELPTVDSDTVTVTVTAPNGPLALDGSGIPAGAIAGEDLRLYIPVPDHAESMNWELFLNRDHNDERQQPDCSGRGALDMTILAGEVIAGNIMELRVWAGAVGYESVNADFTIHVLEAHEDRITLTVTQDGEPVSQVQVNEDVTVTITVDGTELEPEYVQYYNGDRFWSYWDNEHGCENDRLELDRNNQWTLEGENFGSDGFLSLYARAWIPDEENVDGGVWVCSDPVGLAVTRTGRAGELSVNLEKATVTRGEPATLRYTEAANSDESRYDLRHERDRAGDGEDRIEYDLQWSQNEGRNEITIRTAAMPAGEYLLSVWAQGAAGYEGRESAQVRLKVNESSVPAGQVRVTVEESWVKTYEDIYAGAVAPGADWVELIRINEDGREDRFAECGGEGVSGSFRENVPQTVQVFARAHYFERDENGDPIPETDEWGNEYYKELKHKDSEAVSVNVQAPRGKIEQNTEGIPPAAYEGEDLTLTMLRPDNAGYMGWTVYLDEEDDREGSQPDQRGEGAIDLTIEGDSLTAGKRIKLSVWTGGTGYEHNHRDYYIPVLETPAAEITLSVTQDGEPVGSIPVNRNFTVTVTAPGAEAIQYYDGYGFRKHWDNDAQQDVITDLEPDDSGVWTSGNESFGTAGEYALYARALVGREWITSAPVAVTATRSGTVDDLTFTPQAVTVIRGELVTIKYEYSMWEDHSDESGYELRHERNRRNDEGWVDYRLDGWRIDEENDSISFSTAQMPAGEYLLNVWIAGAEGYEGKESSRIRLTVNDPEENEERTVGFEVNKATVQTNEEIQAGVYAPGATGHEIHWRDEDTWNIDGETWTGSYSYQEAGTYQAFVRAWYDNPENPGGQISVDSDIITITVTSNGQKMPLDLSGVPARFIASQTGQSITVPRPEGSANMGWEIWIDDTKFADDGESEDGSIDAELPGAQLHEGGTVLLKVWVDAVGYDHNHQELRIPVVSAEEDNEITLTVDAGEDETAETCEWLECTATFTAGAYSRIQFFDGNEYLDEQDIDEDATEWTGGTCFPSEGTYTLYARLWDGAKWVYTDGAEVEVCAPNGPLTVDVSGIPAGIYEGRDATFAFGTIKDSSGDPVADCDLNYELYTGDGSDPDAYLIEWNEEGKTGTVTIESEDISDGEVYRLNYNVTARGYQPATGHLVIRAYAEPTVTLSVDKKNVTYGDEVHFTVNAPGATSTSVTEWVDGACGADMYWTPDKMTWKTGWYGEDEIGTYQFGAKAEFEGYGTVYTSRPVTVNVRSLGEAPAPDYVDIPDGGTEGAGYHIYVTPAPGGWVSIWIYYGEEVNSVTYRMDGTTELEINDVLVGTYRVVIEYGMDGYDDARLERSFEVGYWFNCRRPEWEWAEDLSAATAKFSSLRQVSYDPVEYEAYLPIEAEVTSEVTEEPTCSMEGTRTYTATERYSGYNYTDTKEETLPMTAHDWGEPAFTWTETEGGYTATATFSCENCEETREEDAEVTFVRHTDATCTEPEITVWRATCEGYSEEKTEEGEGELGHDWPWNVVWNDDYTAYATRRCSHCGASERVDLDVTSRVTREGTCLLKEEITWSVDEMLSDGTHLESLKKQYTSRAPHDPGETIPSDDGHYAYTYCSVCRELLSAEFRGHDWSEPTYVWSHDCSKVTATRTCNMTPDMPHNEIETVTATGVKTEDPTCTEKGVTAYTSAAFGNEAFTVQTTTAADIPALGHDWGEPTYTWIENEHGNITQIKADVTCRHDGSHTDTETVGVTAVLVKAPTEKKAGSYYLQSEPFENEAFSVQRTEEIVIPNLGVPVLKLPEGLKEIEEGAFAGSDCQLVIVPVSCESIGAEAFKGCPRLRYVKIKNPNTTIGRDAFDKNVMVDQTQKEQN